MKIKPKRGPKVIFEENPTQTGVPRKADGARRQEQAVPSENKTTAKTEIWDGCPVPNDMTVPKKIDWHRQTVPNGTPVPVLLLRLQGNRKGDLM